MEKIDININKYIDLEERYALYGEYWDYIDKYVIYSICSDYLNLSFKEINDYVNSAGLKLTEDEIITFLKEREKEDNRDESKDNNSNKSKSQIFADNFMKKLKLSTYSLNPTTLEYFRMYLGNLKQNASNLVDLVDNIGNDEYKELFASLDIHITGDKIYYEDAIRLCKPIIYNVLKLREMEAKANNKETYLTFSVSEDYLGRSGLNLSDLCPLVGYQFSPFEMTKQDGYIELTERQKEEAFDRVLSRAATICAYADVQNMAQDKRLGYINKNRK